MDRAASILPIDGTSNLFDFLHYLKVHIFLHHNPDELDEDDEAISVHDHVPEGLGVVFRVPHCQRISRSTAHTSQQQDDEEQSLKVRGMLSQRYKDTFRWRMTIYQFDQLGDPLDPDGVLQVVSDSHFEVKNVKIFHEYKAAVISLLLSLSPVLGF
jgi:hypothetical protein